MILGWEKVERPWKFRTTRCSVLEFVVLNSYVMSLNHKHYCHASSLQSAVAHVQDLIKFAIGFIYSWFCISDGIYDMGLVSEPDEQLECYLTSRLYQCHVIVTHRTQDWSRCVSKATLALVYSTQWVKPLMSAMSIKLYWHHRNVFIDRLELSLGWQ